MRRETKYGRVLTIISIVIIGKHNWLHKLYLQKLGQGKRSKLADIVEQMEEIVELY